MSTKSIYLSDTHVNGFAEFVATLIKSARLPPKWKPFTYIVRDPEWKKWCVGSGRPDFKYAFSCFKDAHDQYWWGSQTGQNLTHLGAPLKIKGVTEDHAFIACAKILAWGGVNNAMNGVIDAYDNSCLLRTIRTGADVLVGDAAITNATFPLPMNAGWTKIYAAYQPQSIIYDGRVGAALCAVVRGYLEQLALPAATVPASLQFLWGDGHGHSGRIPSRGPYKFGRLNSQRPFFWAVCNQRANWILDAVLKQNGVGDALERSWRVSPGEELRALEKALFMIGYDVSSTL